MAIIKRTSYGRSTNTITGIAGEYIPQYSLVYCNIADSGRYYNATNNLLFKESDVVGIALVSVNKNEVGTYKVSGTIINSSWSWTPGEALYLGVSGLISRYKDVPSSAYIKPIGFAESATSINLVLSSGYKEDEIEIDADQLEINYQPKGYFPTSSGISKSSTSLGSHLKGLDEATTVSVTGEAGEFIPRYSVVYVDSNNKLRLAVNSNEDKVDILGISDADIAKGQIGKVIVKGLINNSSWSWTSNKWVYLSSILGELTQVEPTLVGSYVTPVGLAISSDTVNIHAMISWPVSATSSNDELSLGFTPSSYTPSIVEGFTTSTSQLTSHLNGIDTKLGLKSILTNVEDDQSITLNLALSDNFKFTLSDNRVLKNPINFNIGQNGIIIVCQDSVGGRVLSYDTMWQIPNNSLSLLSTLPNSIDIISYLVVSSNLIIAQVNPQSPTFSSSMISDFNISVQSLVSSLINEPLILDNSISLSKIENFSQGNILYYNEGRNLTTLPPGINGYVLTSGGSNNPPSWQTSSLLMSHYSISSSLDLSTQQVIGSIIDNYGQSSDITVSLPNALAGYNFIFFVSSSGNGKICIKPYNNNFIFLNGTRLTINHKVQLATPVMGNSAKFFAVRTSLSSYNWYCQSIDGTFTDGGI